MAMRLFQLLNNQRRNGQFCDVIIEIQTGDSVFGHFSVVAGQSEFVGGEHFLSESLQFSIHNPLKIEIFNFDCFSCLEKIMDYFYCDKVEVSTEHEQHFKHLAKILHVTNLVNLFFEGSERIDPLSQNNVTVNILEGKGKYFYHRAKPSKPHCKTNSCPKCNFKCFSPKEMAGHLSICSSKGTVCSLCDVEFYTRKDFCKHLEKHDDKKPFFCLDCDLRFYTRAALNMHTPKHSTEKAFECSDCSRRFKWKHGLKSHQLVHSKEKMLLCDECGYSTGHLKSLKAHKLIHNGQVLRCTVPDCKHTSTRKENLKLHMSTHNKETPFVCEICGHRFSQNKNLKRHALIHTTSKDNYKCPHCSFSSHRSDKLKEHIARHHTEKPIQLELPENVHNSFDTRSDDDLLPSNIGSFSTVGQSEAPLNKLKKVKRKPTRVKKFFAKKVLPILPKSVGNQP